MSNNNCWHLPHYDPDVHHYYWFCVQNSIWIELYSKISFDSTIFFWKICSKIVYPTRRFPDNFQTISRQFPVDDFQTYYFHKRNQWTKLFTKTPLFPYRVISTLWHISIWFENSFLIEIQFFRLRILLHLLIVGYYYSVWCNDVMNKLTIHVSANKTNKKIPVKIKFLELNRYFISVPYVLRYCVFYIFFSSKYEPPNFLLLIGVDFKHTEKEPANSSVSSLIFEKLDTHAFESHTHTSYVRWHFGEK